MVPKGEAGDNLAKSHTCSQHSPRHHGALPSARAPLCLEPTTGKLTPCTLVPMGDPRDGHSLVRFVLHPGEQALGAPPSPAPKIMASKEGSSSMLVEEESLEMWFWLVGVNPPGT